MSNKLPYFILIISLISLFFLLVIRKFIVTFYLSPKPNKLKVSLWFCYFLFQVISHINTFLSSHIILLLNIAFIFLICTTTYYSSAKKNCLFSLSICTVWMLVEIIVGTILNFIPILPDILQIAGAAFSSMIMLFISILASHYIKIRNQYAISIKYFMIMLVVPSGSIYLMHNIFKIASEHNDHLFFSIISSTVLLIINYVIFEVYDEIAQNAEIKKKNLLYEQQLELCNLQAKERESYNYEIRKVKHDIKSHMSCLLGLVQDEKRECAIEYINKLINENIKFKAEDISKSGNIIIDSLVNYKYTVARKEEINFYANIIIPIILPFQPGHLAIILGNLLDNAIEACQRIQKANRYIKLEITYNKSILSLIISNPYEGKCIIVRDGNYLSTKIDSKNHGLGLNSVRQAVAYYGGEITIDFNNNIFNVVIVLIGNE